MNYRRTITISQAFSITLIILALAAGAVSAVLQPFVVVDSFGTKGLAAPGSEFVLVVNLSNTEPSACAQAVTTTVQASAPFVMRGVTTRSAGDLCAGQLRTVEFPMRIDPSATGGFYQLQVTSNYETSLLSQFSNSNTINVFVTGSPELSASITGSQPVDVHAGDVATIQVTIENQGSFVAQNVGATLSADAPVDVKWAGRFASVGSLPARSSRVAKFTIEVPKDAVASDYPMTLALQYDDENLAARTVRLPLLLHVKPKALFATVDAGSDALFANDNARVVRLKLRNSGSDVAIKAKVKVLPQFPISTDGSVRFVDRLAPGADAPLEFVVNVDKDATVGSYGLDVLVDFEDAQGVKLQDTATLMLTVREKSFFRAWVRDYWFLWVAALAIVFVIVRRRMKPKSKA